MSSKDHNEEEFEEKDMQLNPGEEEDIVLTGSSQHSNPKIITRLSEDSPMNLSKMYRTAGCASYVIYSVRFECG